MQLAKKGVETAVAAFTPPIYPCCYAMDTILIDCFGMTLYRIVIRTQVIRISSQRLYQFKVATPAIIR